MELQKMELQKAVALLQLEGEILTERLIRDAFKAKIKQAQDQAIGASSEDSIKAFRVNLESFSKAQSVLLNSIIDSSSSESSVVVNFTKDNNSDMPIVDFDVINADYDTVIETDEEQSISSPNSSQQNVKNETIYEQEPKEKKRASSGKFTFLVVFLALLGSGGAAYHYGFLDPILDKLNPVDVSTIEGQLIEAARIQGQIKVLSQRLNNGLRDLKTDLKDAQQDTSLKNIEHVETLRLAYQLSQSYFVDGNILLELEGKASQAQSLLSRQKPSFELQQKALYMLDDVKTGYQNLWLQFKASQQIYPAQSKANKLNEKIASTIETYQFSSPNEMQQAAQLMNTAKASVQAGQFTHAINYYEQINSNLITLSDKIESLQKAKVEASKAKNNFDNAIREYNLTMPDTEYANDLSKRAALSSDQGDIIAATSLYGEAELSWQTALKNLSEEIKQVIAAQKALAAKQALAAKKVLAAKQALAEKKALAAKQALAAKKALAKREALAAKEAQRIAIEKNKASTMSLKEKLRSVEEYVGKLVSIQGSSFLMGSNTGEANERPLHRVNLASFKMMEHEVTFAQWDKCVAAGGCRYRPDDKGWGRGNHPVISVSFNDITQQYIPWLNKTTGLTFTLPSEAQWEYAAREGSRSQKDYSWGVDVGVNQANCRFCGSKWDHNMTAPVKSFRANKWGLYDMHGNAGEAVLDCWHDNYNGAPNDGRPWLSKQCQKNVTRGGSWVTEPYKIRSSYRIYNSLDYRNVGNGFRLVHN